MEIIQEIGAYAGLAAVVGLAVLAALYFSQARDVKRLREWAGRAPERAFQQVPRVVAQPQPRRAAKAQAAGAGAAAATNAQGPGSPSPAAAREGDGEAPAEEAATASGAPATAAGQKAAPAAAGAAPPAAAGTAPPAAGKEAAEPTAQPTGATPATEPSAPATEPSAPVKGSGRPPTPGAGAARPPTEVLPPYGGTPRERPWSRLLRSPRYLVLAIVGMLLVGGGAAFGVYKFAVEEAPPPKEASAGDATIEPERPAPRRRAPLNLASVTVAVLNGTGVPGLAAQIGDKVEAQGFDLGTVANSTDEGQRAESVVLFAPGAEREAVVVGRKLGISQREPIDPQSQALGGDAKVVVIAGADQTR